MFTTNSRSWDSCSTVSCCNILGQADALRHSRGQPKLYRIRSLPHYPLPTGTGPDLPTAGREALLNGLQGPEHHAVTHAHQASAAHGLDHLGVEQPGQWHPAWFRRRALCPLARRLDPLTVVGQQRRRVLLETIGEKERDTAGRQHLDDLMDHTLRHGPR